MRRWARDQGLWLTLGVLALLLVALAVLQYRWTGEIGRAESERRQAQVERQAARFAAGLDRELGHLLVALRPEPQAAGERRLASLQARLSAWRGDERAPLVAAVLLASRQASGQVLLERCAADGSACSPAEWTKGLASVRERLSQPAGGGREGAPFRPATIVEDPLALVTPLFEVGEEPGPGERRGRFHLNGVVIVELDAAYLRERVLPQLAETTFGPAAESEFTVAVLRRADRSIVYASAPGAGAGEPRQGDLQLGIPFVGRLAPGEQRPERGWRFFARLEGRPDRPRPPRDDDAPWLLLVSRRGGTLEQAVAAVRRRNLAVGLGVLALLGAAGLVLATSAQRARDLARQQLEFVAGVTHELNTPLAAIRSAGQNLADGIVTDAQQVRRYGGLIEKEGSRLTSLVAQVLDFAGIESGSRAYAAEPVALGRVVDDVVQDMRLVLEQGGLSVTRDVAADLPDVIGDAAALRRVLTNLLANAVKFAAAGRCVVVRAATAGGPGQVELRIEDRGPGIPPTERERVFEPFYRGAAAQRNETPGNGLGLSLVRRVVLAHHGRVRVEDAAGGGTAVVIELPAAPAAAGSPA
jgi:signal transduction histidine kinase